MLVGKKRLEASTNKEGPAKPEGRGVPKSRVGWQVGSVRSGPEE